MLKLNLVNVVTLKLGNVSSGTRDSLSASTSFTLQFKLSTFFINLISFCRLVEREHTPSPDGIARRVPCIGNSKRDRKFNQTPFALNLQRVLLTTLPTLCISLAAAFQKTIDKLVLFLKKLLKCCLLFLFLNGCTGTGLRIAR